MLYQPPVGGGANDPYVTGVPGVSAGSIPPAEAIEHPQREILSVITAAGLTPSAANLAQLLAAIRVLCVSSGYMLVSDQKAAGTDGGSSIAGTQTRTLNTVNANTISGASLASNQITLPAGTYRIKGKAPASRVNASRVSFYNVTDAAVAIGGCSGQGTIPAGDAVNVYDSFSGRITIGGTKVFQVTHYTENATATTGLGLSVPDGKIEIYTEVEIIKES